MRGWGIARSYPIQVSNTVIIFCWKLSLHCLRFVLCLKHFLVLKDYFFNRKDSRYTEKDAAIVVRQMLKVAAECHLHGFVHRDMKPENFLFKSPKEDSHLKATDFGLSDFIRPGIAYSYLESPTVKCLRLLMSWNKST